MFNEKLYSFLYTSALANEPNILSRNVVYQSSSDVESHPRKTKASTVKVINVY